MQNISSSFNDAFLANEILVYLREGNHAQARSKLNHFFLNGYDGPLLQELHFRLNCYPGPHLIIDGIWFSQPYGGISRVWSSILDTFRISALFPSSSPLTIINRQNSCFSLESFTTINATHIDPFDLDSFQTLEEENSQIVSNIPSSVFCSSWISSSGSSSSCPEVVLLHDMIPELFGVSGHQLLSLRNRWLSGAKAILAVSSYSASQYRSSFSHTSHIQWCHPPLNTALNKHHMCSLSDNYWMQLFSTFGSAKGYFYLPTAARLGSYKNPDVLLRALCDPRLIEFHLIISGAANNSFRNEIVRHFPALRGRVHFAGFSDVELCSVYKNVLCVVVPSLVEGFGLPVVEAASLGCLAVVADSPGLVEAAHNCALRFPPHNFKYLSDLLFSLTDPTTFKWYRHHLLPRSTSRVLLLSPDLFALCLLAQSRAAFNS